MGYSGYASLIGDPATPHSKEMLLLGHIPIDSIIVNALEALGLPESNRFRPWSSINSYDIYMNFQEWIRRTFPDSAPLAVEFHLWSNEVYGRSDSRTDKIETGTPES